MCVCVCSKIYVVDFAARQPEIYDLAASLQRLVSVCLDNERKRSGIDAADYRSILFPPIMGFVFRLVLQGINMLCTNDLISYVEAITMCISDELEP